MNKNDLDQISKLLDEKITPIKNELARHGLILSKHSAALAEQSKTLSEHTKILKQHGKILRSLKKDQGMMLRILNHEQMRQKRRINSHLDILTA